MINWERLRHQHNYPSVSYMLISVYQKFGSLPRAAEFLGISRTSLWFKMKKLEKAGKLGFKFKWGGLRPCKKMLDDVPAEWFEQYTIAEIARKAGCHENTVRRYLKGLEKKL